MPIDARSFAGKPLVINALRAAHLVGVVGTGAALIARSDEAAATTYAWVMVLSGAGIMALDAWANAGYFRRVKGLGVLAKLALVGWMIGDAARAPVLFWVLLVGSSLLSHAPGGLRNRCLIGRDTARPTGD